jgi:hypothetical protein
VRWEQEERDVNRTRATTLAATAVTFLTLLSANAQVTGGALRMVEGASLSTQVDAAFHNIGDDGLTIEGWFISDEFPKVGVRAGTDISVFKGLVDEVRVSSIARYDGRDAHRPRHFTADDDTVALWTFDGPRPFADRSSAGRHFTAEGGVSVEPLAVDARRKIATRWGALKSR